MIDRYENIRKALAMEPTPGPWTTDNPECSIGSIDTLDGKHRIAQSFEISAADRNAGYPVRKANAAHIAACDPDTIRALLAERDALENRVAQMLDALRSAEALAFCCMAEDCYSRREIRDMAEASAPRYTAAIAAANGGGDE